MAGVCSDLEPRRSSSTAAPARAPAGRLPAHRGGLHTATAAQRALQLPDAARIHPNVCAGTACAATCGRRRISPPPLAEHRCRRSTPHRKPKPAPQTSGYTRSGPIRPVAMEHPRIHAHLVTCDPCAFRRAVERSTRPQLPRVGGLPSPRLGQVFPLGRQRQRALLAAHLARRGPRRLRRASLVGPSTRPSRQRKYPG